MNPEVFWKSKKVFITGHTGFKGSWLCLCLNELGAETTGYAWEALKGKSLFTACGIEDDMNSIVGDIRDKEKLLLAMKEAKPEIVIHLAAQPLVGESYNDPASTYETNVMGTAYLLDAVRCCSSVKAVLIITTDKCYENREWPWGYRETDRLGGHDPYASSKACVELLVSSYRRSFFQDREISIATARAGNVIGSGDWAKDRLIPDCIAALSGARPLVLRNPRAIRPWQHVLEALSGYLLLMKSMYESPHQYEGAWNFGPGEDAERSVREVVEILCREWGLGQKYHIVYETQEHYHESCYLKLDSSKARQILYWRPRWSIEEALEKTIEGYKAYIAGGDIKQICLNQIAQYKSGRT